MSPSESPTKCLKRLRGGIWKLQPSDLAQCRSCLAAVRRIKGLRAVVLDLTAESGHAEESDDRLLPGAFPVPTISAFSGNIAGWKTDLAIGAHLCFADETATIELTGNDRAFGNFRKPGSGASSIVSARQLAADGLINRPLANGGVLELAIDTARRISRMAPLAVRACVMAVELSNTCDLEEGLEREIDFFSELFETEDMRIGTRSFLRKKRPVFRGN